MARLPQPGDPPAPTSPYPDDPNRSTARCPRAEDKHRPLRWNGEAWRCSRGHSVPPSEVLWGESASRGGRPEEVGGDVIQYKIGDERRARLLAIAAAETGGNEQAAMRAVLDEAFTARDATYQPPRPRGKRARATA